MTVQHQKPFKVQKLCHYLRPFDCINGCWLSANQFLFISVLYSCKRLFLFLVSWCLVQLQLNRKHIYWTHWPSEPWVALKALLSILVTFSQTWWGSSMLSKTFCFGQRRPCSPSGQWACSLKERHPVWRRQRHCVTLMYVVICVCGCSYFVVRGITYEVLADCKNDIFLQNALHVRTLYTPSKLVLSQWAY